MYGAVWGLKAKLDRVCPGLQRGPIFGNISWLGLEQMLRLGGSFLFYVILARYLGPEEYGTFNYSMALVAIFAPIAAMGIEGVIVKSFIESPGARSELVAAGLLIRFCGGQVAYLLTVLSVLLLRPGDALARELVIVLGFIHLLRAADVVKCWFESEVDSRAVVLIQSAVFLSFLVLKLCMVSLGLPLLAFVYAMLGEFFFCALGLLLLYQVKVDSLWSLRLKLGRILQLLRQSWPLLLSGLAIILYMRMDKIMLGQILGDRAVGIYSAGSSLSEVWSFVPMIIAASVFPSIFKLRSDRVLYKRRFQQLFDLSLVLSVPVAVLMGLSSALLIQLLYGESYAGASLVLSIHIWGYVFIFLGVIGGRWYIAENLEKIIFYRTLAGALLNLVLNLLLIPNYGPAGAAFATLLSQAFASFLFNALSSRTRELFRMQCSALTLGGWRRRLFGNG
jgi:PST family polysaccharide transporter